MRKFQLIWVLLFAGLAACGGEIADDGRVPFQMQITFTDPIVNSALFDVTYELTSPEGYVVSDGQIASNLAVQNGFPTVIDAAFYAKPGDSLTLSMVAAFNGGTLSSDGLFHVIGESDVGVDLGVNYFEQEDAYVLSLEPYVPAP